MLKDSTKKLALPLDLTNITLTNMSVIVYRGDDREPGEIKRKGFIQKTARDDRVTWARTKIRAIYAEDAAAWCQNHIGYNDPDVVSTDLDPNGQAFERGVYVYRIEFPILPYTADYVRQAIALPQAKLNPLTGTSFRPKIGGPFWPTLYLNRSRLDDATIIALGVRGRLSSKEVDFFTVIPPQNIVGWKKTDSAGIFNMVFPR